MTLSTLWAKVFAVEHGLLDGLLVTFSWLVNTQTYMLIHGAIANYEFMC